jgi:hypothetical protein
VIASVYSEFDVEVPHEGDLHGDMQVRLDASQRLSHTDGTPAESFAELKQQCHGPPLTPGAYPQRMEFPDGRLRGSMQSRIACCPEPVGAGNWCGVPLFDRAWF